MNLSFIATISIQNKILAGWIKVKESAEGCGESTILHLLITL